MKTNDISHEGTIISIEKENLRVRIIQNSACASCKIAGHCQTAESKEKIIEVTTPDYADFAVGDKVNVTESVGVGAKAVVFGFILPLALMMAAIISAITAFDTSEGVAALAGIASLLPYYLVLYFLRGYMKNIMGFGIDKINN
ncbi:MAG: SoxR reducing system RseC family protein [Prevotella sp.]|nr:SoxR reducing system RseC family protein [Prevotella sp.]MDY3964832.1 SoxR reducing system RseC family protein [Prevotella sp.]